MWMRVEGGGWGEREGEGGRVKRLWLVMWWVMGEWRRLVMQNH
jgi:hypothetical protein